MPGRCTTDDAVYSVVYLGIDKNASKSNHAATGSKVRLFLFISCDGTKQRKSKRFAALLFGSSSHFSPKAGTSHQARFILRLNYLIDKKKTGRWFTLPDFFRLLIEHSVIICVCVSVANVAKNLGVT